MKVFVCAPRRKNHRRPLMLPCSLKNQRINRMTNIYHLVTLYNDNSRFVQVPTFFNVLKLYNFFVEKRIVNAAKTVAETLGGDKTKTTSDLLEKVLTSRVEALKKEQANMYVNCYITKYN